MENRRRPCGRSKRRCWLLVMALLGAAVLPALALGELPVAAQTSDETAPPPPPPPVFPTAPPATAAPTTAPRATPSRTRVTSVAPQASTEPPITASSTVPTTTTSPPTTQRTTFAPAAAPISPSTQERIPGWIALLLTVSVTASLAILGAFLNNRYRSTGRPRSE